MSASTCILCFEALEKRNDWNKVDGKSNVNLALNDFPFLVHPCSPYICKKCLIIAKKRSEWLQRIQEIDLELTTKYRAKCQEAGLSLKMKS